MKRYLLSLPAQNDLAEIKEYLLEHADVRVARYVLHELREGMRFLAEWPDVGHLREDLTGEQVKFWPVFSYLIIYDPKASPIEIVRVLRASRDITQLLDPTPTEGSEE